MAEYSALGGISGGLSGAATGAAIGSVVPVIGTTIGAIAGGVLGLAGGFGGGGGGGGLQDPFGIAKRNAIALGLVPPGKVGAEVFKQLLVNRDPSATQIYLQAGGNPNKFGAGFYATQALGGMGTTEAAPPASAACDPRAAHILALLVQALEREKPPPGFSSIYF